VNEFGYYFSFGGGASVGGAEEGRIEGESLGKRTQDVLEIV